MSLTPIRCTFVMSLRDTHPVYVEHMVLMLCALEPTDWPTNLAYTYSSSPFPNVPLRCDKKHQGLAPTNAKFSRQECEIQSYRTTTHTDFRTHHKAD